MFIFEELGCTLKTALNAERAHEMNKINEEDAAAINADKYSEWRYSEFHEIKKLFNRIAPLLLPFARFENCAITFNFRVTHEIMTSNENLGEGRVIPAFFVCISGRVVQPQN